MASSEGGQERRECPTCEGGGVDPTADIPPEASLRHFPCPDCDGTGIAAPLPLLSKPFHDSKPEGEEKPVEDWNAVDPELVERTMECRWLWTIRWTVPCSMTRPAKSASAGPTTPMCNAAARPEDD